MSIVIDDKKITNINISNKNVQKIVDILTNKIIFEKTKPVSNEYFYIENTYNGSNTISLKTTIGSGNITGSHATQLQYSKDKKTWKTITLSGTNTIPMKSGERVYFRNDSGSFNWYINSEDSFYTQIKCSNNHKVGGNINSLLDYNNYNVAITLYCFYQLFYKNKYLTDASELIFSKTNLAPYCYQSMFYNCTTLKTAPTELPATTLAEYCYDSMFENCTSLTTAPELPATTLAIGCYNQMFSSCSKLTTAPALPATTLASDCYERMFEVCTSLVNAPELSATTLADYCYRYMFYDCRKLNSITVYANDVSATDCTTYWLSGVASSGTFRNLGSATYPRNGNGIPTGWTEVKN